MRKFESSFIKLMQELYDMYEMYVFRYDGCRVDVLMQDSSICFYLYDKDELIDEVILQFNDKNGLMYKYMCAELIVIMFGYVIIHRDGNICNNQHHKPGVSLIVNDDEILDIIIKMMERQEEVGSYWKIIVANDLYENVPLVLRSRRFIKRFDERVRETRELIKSRRMR